ncbi:hypothetical protein TPAR_02301 [Tolypocladium paradoxum]|uniref:Secreted protein n=1 Tax=Tolypocladium paradoxum TaxID=94208 RepID=A0A2S4L507_9HYPO|nr:hypothetical protein TPAR_02301 [Tolypocladium paradoxum]
MPKTAGSAKAASFFNGLCLVLTLVGSCHRRTAGRATLQRYSNDKPGQDPGGSQLGDVHVHGNGRNSWRCCCACWSSVREREERAGIDNQRDIMERKRNQSRVDGPPAMALVGRPVASRGVLSPGHARGQNYRASPANACMPEGSILRRMHRWGYRICGFSAAGPHAGPA